MGSGLVLIATPHRYSAEALERRRARARTLGYLRHLPPGSQYVEVPADLTGRVRTITKSLAMHQTHSILNGRPSHYARTAAHAAMPTASSQTHSSRRPCASIGERTEPNTRGCLAFAAAKQTGAHQTATRYWSTILGQLTPLRVDLVWMEVFRKLQGQHRR